MQTTETTPTIDYTDLHAGTRDVNPGNDPWPFAQELVIDCTCPPALTVFNNGPGHGAAALCGAGEIPLCAVPGNLTPEGGRSLAEVIERTKGDALEAIVQSYRDGDPIGEAVLDIGEDLADLIAALSWDLGSRWDARDWYADDKPDLTGGRSYGQIVRDEQANASPHLIRDLESFIDGHIEFLLDDRTDEELADANLTRAQLETLLAEAQAVERER